MNSVCAMDIAQSARGLGASQRHRAAGESRDIIRQKVATATETATE
jgi:hypothetical protein